MEYRNGSLWHNPNTLQVVVVQKLVGEIYCLMEMGSEGMAVVLDHQQAGKWQYHVDELPELLKGWESLTPTAPSDLAEIAREEKAQQETEVLNTVKAKVKKGKI